MKNQRLKQFAASVLVVLSLFVSSVSAACTCSRESETNEFSHCHQPSQTKSENHSAHQHSPDTQAKAHHEENLPESVSVSVSLNDCCCVQSAPRVFASTENIKIKKQALAVLPSPLIEFVSISQVVSTKTVGFVTPFYLSDSFHNLTPGRAPPRL